MKLTQSLALYGLVDRPADKPVHLPGVHVLDYDDYLDINQQDDVCLVRIRVLVALLSTKYLGTANTLEVDVSIASVRGAGSSGLLFRACGRVLDYRWTNTANVKYQHRWTCGWVESAYRRFLTGICDDLPARFCDMIPHDLEGWPL